MEEEIVFHFEGSLAATHRMNFYEAARFQYAAARLIVKLDQFRRDGKFSSRITENTNQEIFLRTQSDGSFDITIAAPLVALAGDYFVNLAMQNMLSYVFDRLIGKTSDSEVADSLNSQPRIVEAIGKIHEESTSTINQALSIIAKDQTIKESMRVDHRDLLERRIAELERERTISSQQNELSKIDRAREQKLISMSAPLVSEMATSLRRSASTLEIVTSRPTSPKSRIVFLNREMAQEIELSSVDAEITPILCDIVQYNKETGWGKARLHNATQPLSFNVPSDLKQIIQKSLLDAMNKDKVFLQSYYVRDKSNMPIRMIIVGILPTPVDK